MCISDLSKVLMLEFYCRCIKNKYGNNSRILLTDTDNLMYEIKIEDVFKEMKKCFDLVIIHPSQSIIMIQKKQFLVK